MAESSNTSTKTPASIRRAIAATAIGGIAIALIGVLLDLYLEFAPAEGKIPVGAMRNLLYPNAEANLFAWYSSTVLAALGLTFVLMALVARGAGDRTLAFVILAATSLVLSADETAALHERLGLVANVLGAALSWSYAWLILGVPVALVVGAALLWVARSIDTTLRNRLVLGGVVFLLGAVGGEAVGGMLTKVDLGLAADTQYVLHSVAVFVEESLEVAGAVIALWAALTALRARYGSDGMSLTLARRNLAVTE